MLEFCRCGGAAQQPLRTEPCQCVSGQLWAFYGTRQDQMHPLLCAAGVRAAVGLGRWFCVGVQFCWFLELSRGGASTRQPQRTEPRQCLDGQPWTCHDGALQGQMQPLLCSADVVGPALGAAAGLGKWFVGVVAVLPVCGDYQRRR